MRRATAVAGCVDWNVLIIRVTHGAPLRVMVPAPSMDTRPCQRAPPVSFGIGPFELFLVVAAALVAWLVPIAAAVWAIVTLARLRRGQDELRARLVAIERRLS